MSRSAVQMLQFNAETEVEGNRYAAPQVVTFPDDYDLSSLPGLLISTAPVFVDHVPRVSSLPPEN